MTKWRRPARSTGTCSVHFATHIVTASTTLVLTVLAVVTRHTACKGKNEEQEQEQEEEKEEEEEGIYNRKKEKHRKRRKRKQHYYTLKKKKN